MTLEGLVVASGRRVDVDAVLDAVRDCVLAVGVRRTTLSDVARRAGVSRMTIYRIWPDVRTLVGDLMTREWQHVTDTTMAAFGSAPDGAASGGAASGGAASGGAGSGGAASGGAGPGGSGSARERVVAGMVAGTRAMRGHPLLRKIIDVDPELLLPYLLDRRGASQDYALEALCTVIAAGQRDGSIRPGEPPVLARAILLATQSFSLSGRTMADPGGPDLDTLDAELTHLVDRYLAPPPDRDSGPRA